VISLQGENSVDGHLTGLIRDEAAASSLGAALAERLLEQGAATILAEARAAVVPIVTEP
jgi:hypothetical protein